MNYIKPFIKAPVVWTFIILVSISLFPIPVSASHVVGSGGDSWSGTMGWDEKANLPLGLADITAATHNGKIYVFGGYRDNSSDPRNVTYMYDPSTNSWTQKTDMPSATWGHIAVNADGLIHVFTDLEKHYVYNVSSNSWATKIDVPYNLVTGVMGAKHSDKIHLFLSYYHYEYNITAESWSQKNNISIPVTWGTCGVVNNKIYVIGGYKTGGGVTDATQILDINADTWSYGVNCTDALYGTSRENQVINNKIYVSHGQDENSRFFASLHVYDPSADTWEEKPTASYPRDGPGCSVLNSQLYVIGGRNVSANPYGVVYNEIYNLTGANVEYDDTVEVKSTDYIELRQCVDDHTAYWRGDEGSGSTVHDEGETCDGIIYGGVTFNTTSGKYGNAMDFNNGYVSIAPHPNLRNNESQTLCFWLYPHDVAGIDAFLYKGTAEYWNYMQTTLFLYSGVGGIAEVVDDASLSQNDWTYYCKRFNYSANQLELFEGGVSVDTEATSGVYTVGDSALEFGRYYGGSQPTWNYSGLLDEIRYYKRALLQSEINQTRDNEHYTSGNLTSWHDAGASNETYKLSINFTFPTNTNASINIYNNDTGVFIENLASHTTTTNWNGAVTSPVQDSKVNVTLYGNTTETPEIINITYHTQTAPTHNYIYTGANEWVLFNNWSSVSQTFSQITANESNDLAYSYYNSTSGLWESYWVGYSINQDNSIPKNESLMGYFDTATTITCDVPSAESVTIPANVWFYSYLRESTSYNLTQISTSIVSDGCVISAIYGFQNDTQTYNLTGSYTVDPNEGFALYATTGCDWDGGV